MLNTLLVTLCNHSYYKIGSIYSSIDLGKLKVVHAEMLSEEKIHEWWNQKIENYLKNYAKRNKLTLAQARAKIFTETHEKFLETTRTKIQGSIKIVHGQN